MAINKNTSKRFFDSAPKAIMRFTERTVTQEEDDKVPQVPLIDTNLLPEHSL